MSSNTSTASSATCANTQAAPINRTIYSRDAVTYDAPLSNKWQSVDAMPELTPVLARYHPWGDPKNDLKSHIVWKVRGEFHMFPALEGGAFVADWISMADAEYAARLAHAKRELKKLEGCFVGMDLPDNWPTFDF